jgi:hypothetical protein
VFVKITSADEKVAKDKEVREALSNPGRSRPTACGVSCEGLVISKFLLQQIGAGSIAGQFEFVEETPDGIQPATRSIKTGMDPGLSASR